MLLEGLGDGLIALGQLRKQVQKDVRHSDSTCEGSHGSLGNKGKPPDMRNQEVSQGQEHRYGERSPQTCDNAHDEPRIVSRGISEVELPQGMSVELQQR